MIKRIGINAKEASYDLLKLSTNEKNNILSKISESLLLNKEKII